MTSYAACGMSNSHCEGLKIPIVSRLMAYEVDFITAPLLEGNKADLLLAYGSLLMMAILPIFIAVRRSVNTQDQLKVRTQLLF